MQSGEPRGDSDTRSKVSACPGRWIRGPMLANSTDVRGCRDPALLMIDTRSRDGMMQV
jgi:hypothetical protein